MRASDADVLRPVVRDPGLLASLETIRKIWRGPAKGGGTGPG
ncbi:hypothetical protein [Streptomyces sp. NPDC029003]